jgi:phosphate:Na+ symporter
MPFSKWIVKLVEKMVPEKKQKEEELIAVPDERLFRSPAVAVLECDVSTQKMALLSKQVILNALSLFDNYDEKIMNQVVAEEDVIDRYEDKLGTFLVRMSALSLGEDESQKVSKMLHAIGDFERLGDHALNMAKAAKEINDKEIEFSAEAKKEIAVLRQAVEKIIDNTVLAYKNNDTVLAVGIEPLEQVIDKLIYTIRVNHIERLRKGNCTIELGFVLSDVLTNYERISDHCSNIAVSIIETAHGSFDPHKYLSEVKHDNAEFDRMYKDYLNQYAI